MLISASILGYTGRCWLREPRAVRVDVTMAMAMGRISMTKPAVRLTEGVGTKGGDGYRLRHVSFASISFVISLLNIRGGATRRTRPPSSRKPRGAQSQTGQAPLRLAPDARLNFKVGSSLCSAGIGSQPLRRNRTGPGLVEGLVVRRKCGRARSEELAAVPSRWQSSRIS